ncbi:MAG: PKD domain-containing protein [Flavobacteriales bacterium]|nr:PKD domain-containing protein [Flavobacteriales bacterium]MDW8410091.1 PKD domain-containing protein [Flavobacteriales bacterium]
MSFPPAVYDSLKQAGALPPGSLVESIPLPQAPITSSPQHGNTALSFTYIPPDNTYTLAMPACDDCSSGPITLPFQFCLYGQLYNQVYINNNGNVSFGSPYATYTSTGFPVNGFPMLAPFWADVDTRNGLGQVLYKVTPTALYVNWVNTGYYSMQGDKRNTFMLVLTDGTDPVLSNGNNVGFAYQDMQWTTGAASCWGGTPSPCTYNGQTYFCGGNGGFCGVPATVGANKGDGVDYFLIGRFDHPGTDFNGPTVPSGVDWLDYAAMEFNICNLPPQLVNSSVITVPGGVPVPGYGGGGSGGGAPSALCEGNTWQFSYIFSGPEPNQAVTITVNPNNTPGFNLVSNTQNGNQATVVFTVTAPPGVSGTFTITITATDNYVIPGVTTIQVPVTIAPLPTPVIVGPHGYCQGGNVTLTTTQPYNSYQWQPGGFTTSSITVTAGTYSVTVDSLGCVATSAPFTVVEWPNPQPQILGTGVFCAGGSTQLEAIPSGMSSYAWSNGANTQIITVNQVGLYTVTVTDANGCMGTSAAINVVQGNPSVTITGAQPFCQGDSILLTANGQNFQNILWSTGATTPSIYFSGGQVSVSIIDQYGCQASDNLSLLPSPLPTAAFAAQDVCLSASTQFTDNSFVPTNDITSWEWNLGDGTLTTNQNPIHTYTQHGSYNVSLVVTTAVGCKDTATGTVNVWALPTAAFTSFDHSGCTPVLVSFQDQSSISSGLITSWLWDFGNGQMSSLQNPSMLYSDVDTYTVQLTVISDHGCTHSVTMTDYVQVWPYPTAGFTYYPDAVDLTAPEVMFTDNSSGAIWWQWTFGDGGTSNMPNPTHTYTTAGDMLVTQIVGNQYGCQDTATALIEVGSGYFFFIPSSFTPDNNNLNEEWAPKGTAVREYHLWVFDRWGNQLFFGVNSGWNGRVDGKLVKQDVYVYKIIAWDLAGVEYNYIGTITVLPAK